MNVKAERIFVVPIIVGFYLRIVPSRRPASEAEWVPASNLVVSEVVLPDMPVSKITPPAKGQISLPRATQDAQRSGKLNGTETASVRTYPKANSRWRATFVIGEAFDPATLVGLEISVVDQSALTMRY
jgi:hypothetical protein